MKNKITVLSAMLFCLTSSIGQVQVSKEPRHIPVLENKYIRLLDVWLQPGDTTLFHIHSTPSLFLFFTNTSTGFQIKGQDWVKEQTVAGKSWYRSFTPDVLVHRVSNLDTLPLHASDLEILSSYTSDASYQPLPFTVLFENEKAIAYRLTRASFNRQIIQNRGPLIAQLVLGDEVIYHDTKGMKSTKIKTGKYLYIKPGSSFYFTAKEYEEINLVLFEIK